MIRVFGATVIIGIIANPNDVGFFSASMRIFVALHAFIWLYYFNLLPSFSQAWQKGDDTFSSLIDKSLNIVIWIVLIIGFVWVIAAPIVIKTMYGLAFAPAVVILKWLAGVFIVAGISGHYRYGLIAAEQQNVEMVISAIGAVVAVILIPVGYTFGGLAGSAIGLLVAEVVVWWSTWWWSRKKLKLNKQLIYLVRPMIAAGLSLIALWLLPSSYPAVRIVMIIIIMTGLAYITDSNVRGFLKQLAIRCRIWVLGILDKKVQGAS
jgi:O-antigen/teichoic acid export membrane protein